ncbi:hypothetical protein HDU93_006792, partial [Gonapodya sp. JEL0774]
AVNEIETAVLEGNTKPRGKKPAYTDWESEYQREGANDVENGAREELIQTHCKSPELSK